MKGGNIFKDDDMIDYLIPDNFFSRCSQDWLLNFSKTKHIFKNVCICLDVLLNQSPGTSYSHVISKSYL